MYKRLRLTCIDLLQQGVLGLLTAAELSSCSSCQWFQHTLLSNSWLYCNVSVHVALLLIKYD